jgi:uncharacterized protein (TIGR02147 family)
MEKSIYEYESYKPFLRDFLHSQPKKGHGLKSVWAETLNCKSSYVSQVLNGDAHFSLEQGEDLIELLNLGQEEGNFLQLLIQRERAGSYKLEQRIDSQIKAILKEREKLSTRVEIKDRLPQEVQVKYYSSWHYAAIHMAVTIEHLKTKEAIIEHFQLPPARVSEVLEFLEKVGLLKRENNLYSTGVSRIFLGSDSDLINNHHTNWRVKAIQSLDEHNEFNVNLSTIFTLSKKDLELLREQVLASIEDIRKTVRETKSEDEMVCFNVDLIKV